VLSLPEEGRKKTRLQKGCVGGVQAQNGKGGDLFNSDKKSEEKKKRSLAKEPRQDHRPVQEMDRLGEQGKGGVSIKKHPEKLWLERGGQVHRLETMTGKYRTIENGDKKDQSRAARLSRKMQGDSRGGKARFHAMRLTEKK